MKIALAQIGPRLGDVQANVEKHLAAIARASTGGAEIVVFPELSLTGYYLRDLTTTVAVRPTAADPFFGQLLKASMNLDVIVGFVEETERYLYYNSAAYLSGGKVVHIHRKVYLPTYGMFDEQRFLATGDGVRSFETPFGRFAMLICEDLWHLSLPYLAWLDGADYVIGLVASPGRGVRSSSPRLASAEVWDVLGRALAQFTTSYVVLVNRVGYEDGVGFFGGSLAVAPSGQPVARAVDLDEDLVIAELDPALLRRERIMYPLLRDEQPDLTMRELHRIIEQRGRASQV
jgi:predicted amidohydrolase